LKRLAGIAPERDMPRFADETFKDWYRRQPMKNRGGQKVILWADTFNNHFLPKTAQAAVRVLQGAGFDVRVPGMSLCCGRPLYDFGFLDQARRQLRQILYVLGPALRKGVPVVGLEPSCLAVFRDELTNLFPDDEDAKRLKNQSYLLSEFLDKYAPDMKWQRLDKDALVHGHCHQKSVLGMDKDLKIMQQMGLRCEMPESGCCGMAGAFGFEAEKYDISIACGERVLLPKVRQTNPDALIVTNGFSCREQIRQTTGREALHIAEVMALRYPVPF
jgi:Fe-S oxidoreductase